MKTDPLSFVVERSPVHRVLAATHAAEGLAGEAERMRAARVFLLASKSLSQGTDEIRRIETSLGRRHAGTYTGIRAHAPIQDVVRAAAAAREAGADLIATIGGGALTDAGKIVALALKSGTGLDEGAQERLHAIYRWGRPIDDEAQLAPDVPVICIPTTLSGGEFHYAGGATDATGRKIGFAHKANAPKTIILDPWLSRLTPPWLWFSTGIRGVDHAVETLASRHSNPYCDALAESALRLLGSGLLRAKQEPDDVAARSDCQVGVWLAMAPIAAGIPMGASHAIGHALGSLYGVPHGYTSCVLIPYVQQWNAAHVPQSLGRISSALGAPGAWAPSLLADLIRRLELPGRLGEVGVSCADAQFSRLVEIAGADPWIKTNPRPIESATDIEAILRSSEDGRIEALSSG